MPSIPLALLSVLLAAAAPPARAVDITASDGTKLTATHFPAAGPGPAVLLMHMCNTTRSSWEPVARQLSAAGIHALTVDNRGFGESGGPRFTGARPEVQRALRQQWAGDFDAALAWLASQPGVDRTRIGAGGGSCGVDNAVKFASRHADVRSLVLLAGPTDQAGLDFLASNPWLPVFTAAAADDRYDLQAPEMMRFLAEVSGNSRNQFVGFERGGHGTELFDPHPDLPRQIVTFLVDTLITAPADASAPVSRRATAASALWAAVAQPGGAGKATQVFREARRRDPAAFVFPEPILNGLAYARLRDGDVDDAIALFALNVEAYPASANAQDSLADGYLAAGRHDLALAAAQKCLELLPADPLDDEFKAQVRQAAEDKIAKLKPR